MLSTAIIIAAYNPDEQLPAFLYQLGGLDCHMVVVDDGSNNDFDFTSLNAIKRVTVLRHCINMGQGAALETGIQWALSRHARTFVTADADGQHRAEDVAALLRVFSGSGMDMIIGSRFLEPSHEKGVPFLKRWTLKLGRVFNGLVAGLWLSDAHNGLRVFNARAASCIHFTENRMAHATEILWLMKQHGMKVGELPVKVLYGGPSQHPMRAVEIGFDVLVRRLIP